MFNVPIKKNYIIQFISLSFFLIKLYYNRIIHEIIINNAYGITIIKRESRHASWEFLKK